ncbi:glycoside hydrolase family 73 protein [Paraburkholderia sediminicola]|uniref:glycoside hydrolase family 73 protein n=1 Tax=Paraburkholderia sediminicola TaxID=458836 RepID=UPI0038B9DFBB
MLDAVSYEERLVMAQPSVHHHPAPRHKPKPHVAPAYVQQFIDAHLAAAQEVQRKYQVPAGVVIAQSALESNWGRSVVGNAYFGVKGRAPSGDSTTFTTHEVINGKAIKIYDAFRAYGSYEDAADDYAQMLRNNPRFRSSFLYTRSSQFANALAHNGYATDPLYAVKLNAIIRAHKLDQYDARRTEP